MTPEPSYSNPSTIDPNMPLEHGLPTGPLASRLRGAGGGPVDNPAADHMHTPPSPPSFRLIPELELTFGPARLNNREPSPRLRPPALRLTRPVAVCPRGW